MSLRHLGKRELALFRLFVGCRLKMSPQEFYAKWDVTRAQMAQICGCSVPTVDRWFSRGKHHRVAEEEYTRRLAQMDLMWDYYETLSSDIKQLICPSGGKRRKKLSP